MEMNSEITIIGAGIGGLCTALALTKQGFTVRIYERALELKSTGAGIVLGANAMKSLDFLGVSEQIIQHSFSSNECTIFSDARKKLQSLHYKNNSIPNYTFIHRSDLVKTLADSLPKGSIYFNKHLLDFKQKENHIELYFEDGSIIYTKYVIAADGIRSKIRQKLLPQKQIRFAGYTCWRGVLDNCPDHIEQIFTETWGPRGRFGIVPLSNNRMYWYAFKNSKANDPELAKWTKKELLSNFISYHDPIQQLIEKTPNENIIKHDIYDLEPLQQYTFGNILLVGDAAHAATPDMGQGACQAIEDALHLAVSLKKAQNIEEAFRNYESTRLNHTRRVVQDSRFLGKIAQIDIPLLCSIRNNLARITPNIVHNSRMKNLFEIKQE